VDLAASDSLDKELWWPHLEEADVLLVGGGNTFYLSYWMQQSGLFEAIPRWLDSKVYVGISAGSQVVGANLSGTSEVLNAKPAFQLNDYDLIGPVDQSSGKTLKLVDFTFRPHLNSSHFPKIRLPYLEQVARKFSVPMYAIDDQSAIQVTDHRVEVVSEGQWHKILPGT
jgi:dipeptidase E